MADIITRAMAGRGVGQGLEHSSKTDLDGLSAEQRISYGVRYFATGQWQTAERFFLAALDEE